MNKNDRERYEDLTAALRTAETKRSTHEDAWKDYLEQYSGEVRAVPSRPIDEVHVNMVFQTVEIMIASALQQQPKMYATPRKRESVRQARLAEKIINFWWETGDVQAAIEEAHRDAGIIGLGALKTVWRYRVGKELEPAADEVDAMLAVVEEKAPMLDGPVPSKDDIVKFLKRQSIQIVENRPMVRRVSPFDLWLDPQARSLKDLQWIAHRYHRPLAEVRSDVAYKESARRRVEQSDESLRTDRLPTILDASSALPMVDLVELWDLANEKVHITTYENLGNPDELLFSADFPYAIGHPFTFLPFFSLPDQLYPMGVVELISPLQKELTEIRREQMLQRKAMRRKFAARKGTLDEDAIEALMSDIDGDVALVDDDDRPLAEILYALPTLGVNPELYTQGQMVRADIFDITGVTEYQRGLVSNYRSATEVNTVNQFTNARVAKLIHAVQSAQVDVARKMMGLAAQYMDTRESIRIVGQSLDDLPPNDEAFTHDNAVVFPFNRGDISGEYEIHLEAGSSVPDNSQSRLERLMQFLQISQPIQEANKLEIIRQIAREMGFVDVDRFLSATPAGPPAMPGMMPQGGSVPNMPTSGPGGGPQPTTNAQADGGAAGGLTNVG